MSRTPGETLDLPKEVLEALAHETCALLDDLEVDNRGRIDRIQANWKLYRAEPLAKERNFPFRNASNAVIPITRIFGDATLARIWGALHTPERTWTVKSPNDNIQQRLVPTVSEFLNRESRTTFDVRFSSFDVIQEQVIGGEGVWGLNWSTDIGFRRRPGTNATQRVVLRKGPKLEMVPRAFALWHSDRTIAESPVFARTRLMTWGEVIRASQVGGWDSAVVSELQGRQGIEDSAVENYVRTQRNSESPGSGNLSDRYDPHDIREVWLEASLAQLMTMGVTGNNRLDLGDTEDERVPIVVTLHRKAKKILRVVAYPYFFMSWPFLDFYYRKEAGRGSSMGLAEMLEHMQRVATTVVNQSIDNNTLRNSLKLATSDPNLKNYIYDPSQPIYVEDLQKLIPLNISGNVAQDSALVNVLVAMSERLTGIADINLGRETRLGGHPSPATNTLAQLEEGSKILQMSLEQARRQVAQAGEWIFSLYQQYETGADGRLAQKYGPEDAELLRETLISAESFNFDIASLNESSNPDTERQNAVMVFQVAQSYYSYVSKLGTILENPQVPVGPKTAATLMKAMEGTTELFIRILQSSNIDDVRQFAVDLEGNRAKTIGDINDFQQFLQGQLGQAGGTPQGLPDPGLGGAPPGAAPNGGVPAEVAGSGFNLG